MDVWRKHFEDDTCKELAHSWVKWKAFVLTVLKLLVPLSEN